MKDLNKACEILKAINEVNLDELHIYTYDQGEAMKSKEEKQSLIIGTLVGVCLGFGLFEVLLKLGLI